MSRSFSACSSESLTSSMRMNSSVTMRPCFSENAWTAGSSFASGQALLTGMIWVAHLVGRAVQRDGEAEAERLGGELEDFRHEPAGGDVMRRAPKPRPHSAFTMVSARMRAS
jgi:hypothetical protein